jgi:hypothetical protein
MDEELLQPAYSLFLSQVNICYLILCIHTGVLWMLIYLNMLAKHIQKGGVLRKGCRGARRRFWFCSCYFWCVVHRTFGILINLCLLSFLSIPVNIFLVFFNFEHID